ncbi:MAG: SDR family oxidoreductase [Bacteroidales bacterium]|nr:SDR family oxidoreductase [Bacteroidales bacterium]
MKVKDKTVWITGASSGIGEALAKELFNHGATLILSAPNHGMLEEIRNKFEAVEKGRCYIMPFDITRPDEIQQAVSEIKKLLPRVDILINNAGVSQRSYAVDTQVEVDRRIFEINFFGAVILTKALLPWMIASGSGHIVVMSSMAGKFGFRMRTAYSASKHALIGFFESLRAELNGRNIRITIVCPGRINTELSLRALTGNGAEHGIMDRNQKHGISVARCARIIRRSVECNRKEVFIGKSETLLLVIKRICPQLYYQIVTRVSPT